MNNETIEINVKDLIKGIWKRVWVVILCAVIAMAGAGVYTANFVESTYKASVTLYVNNNADTSDTVSSANLAVAMQLAKTYVKIVKSNAVLEKVIEKTGLNLTAGQIRQMITAEVVDETEIFQVNVISPNAQMSADIANAIASIAPGEIADIIEGSSAKVIDYAKVPASKYAPNVGSSVILGGMVGAVLACALLVVIQLLDKRINSEDDLARICPLPILGAIPDFVENAKMSEKKGEKSERRKA